ncbi:hypothetical protein [Helicobacter trogontum]|nr:hypothetical protein [Helicobacter trogontum]MDY5184523.1 hypothetical protein [Helicobacter trogontum]
MKLLFVVLFCMMSCALYANTDIQDVPLPNLRESHSLDKLYKNVTLQFSKSSKKSIPKKQGIIASKMTHHIFKDSKEVCLMLFFSALKDVQMQALQLGGTKIGNIESYLNGSSKRITKYFQCKSGFIFNIVTLRADVY